MVKTLESGPLKAPFADGFNEAGGRCYDMSAKHALAQLACTGCSNGSYYLSAEQQLAAVKSLVVKVDPEFVAQVAVYAREKGFMKDMPALLCAWLAHVELINGQPSKQMVERLSLLNEIFDRVIDNGTMLRKFWAYIRSGEFGRAGFGQAVKRLVRRWFDNRNPSSIFLQSIGNDPSLADIICMNRPRPDSESKAAVFAYLIGGDVIEENGLKSIKTKHTKQRFDALPDVVKQFEDWKLDRSQPMPKLDFRFLDNGSLSTEHWTEIAKNANWLTTLKNLNTFMRHKVFQSEEMVQLVAGRLRNVEKIKQAKVFPYQIMISFMNLAQGTPNAISEAVQDALEIATANVPAFPCKTHVCLDVSGSMFMAAVTGFKKGATSVARCADVASLATACILRNNPEADVLPFANHVYDVKLNLRDSISTNADVMRRLGGGGTNCSAPLRRLNEQGAKGDLVIFLSDYESWLDTDGHRYSDPVAMAQEWERYKVVNPNAKLVCIDLAPRTNCQVQQRQDILQVGGFSDAVFDIIQRFLEGGWSDDHWVHEINAHWGKGA